MVTKAVEEAHNLSDPSAHLPDAANQIASLVFAMVLIDAQGRIAQVNNATETLLGTSAKMLLGETFTSVVSPKDSRVSDILMAGDTTLVARDVQVRFAGEEHSVNLTMSTVQAFPDWRVITISELGHGKAARDERAASSVGAPSILAHEIKNPLAAIKGAAQLIARKLPHSDKPLSRMITDEVDRIARLVDRMQQLGSQTAPRREPCNLHEAIRSAVATVRAAGMEGVEIVEEYDPSIPPALGQRGALEQVLINLISNARDACAQTRANNGQAHSEQGNSGQANRGQGGRITIRTRYVSGLVVNAMPKSQKLQLPIEVTVSDNGPGVDPELRDRVFEPFVSSKPHGQGLGLALVRKLVRDMDGSITHEREGARGLTHFRLNFSVAPTDTATGEGA